MAKRLIGKTGNLAGSARRFIKVPEIIRAPSPVYRQSLFDKVLGWAPDFWDSFKVWLSHMRWTFRRRLRTSGLEGHLFERLVPNFVKVSYYWFLDVLARRPIHAVVRRRQWAKIGPLVKAGRDPNATDRKNRTPLSLALLNQDSKCVTELIKHGADPMKRAGDDLDHVSFTISHCFESYQFLVGNGVAVNQPLPLQRNPFFAISWRRNPLATAKALLSMGADVNWADLKGDTPLHFAVRFGDGDDDFGAMAKMYLDAGAKHVPNKEGLTPIHEASTRAHSEKWIPLLVANGANPNTRSASGKTPLLDTEDAATAIALIQCGADPTAKAESGETILHHLFNYEFYCTSLEKNTQLTELAISHGANVNAQAKDGNTPLHLAVALETYDDGPELARMFLKNGANPQITNMLGESAIDLAKCEETRSLIARFLEASEKQQRDEHARRRLDEEEARERTKAESSARNTGGGRITEFEIKRQRALASLGLEDTASAEEVVKQYHKLAQIFHTDKTQHLSERDRDTATVQFQKVADAFQFLRDLGR